MRVETRFLVFVGIVLVVYAPEYALSKSKISESAHFSGIAVPSCKDREWVDNGVSITQHLVRKGLEFNFDQRKHTKMLLRRKLDQKSTNDSDGSKGLRVRGGARKYTSAEVSISGSSCDISAKYRLTGDLSDHHDINLSSVKVKLFGNSLGGIQDFKLFVPASRSNKMEVFTTYLFRKLGFLSPRTSIIKVNLNDRLMISRVFQEEIGASFLEYNDIHESFIFKGHEEFGLMKPLSVSAIRNEKLIKTYADGVLAESTLYRLNQIYLRSGLDNLTATNWESYRVDPIVNPDYFPARSQDEIYLFTMLSIAMGLEGGLTKDDSRFVYDAISRRFRPIYYDGHAAENVVLREDGDLIVKHIVKAEHQQLLVEKLLSLDSDLIARDLVELGASYSTAAIERKIKFIVSNINRQRSEPTDLPKKLMDISSDKLMSGFASGNEQQEQLFIVRRSSNVFDKCLVKARNALRCSVNDLGFESLELTRLLVSQQLDKVNADLRNAVYLDLSHDRNSSQTGLQSVWPKELQNVEFMVSENLDFEISRLKRTINIIRKRDSGHFEDAQLHIRGGVMHDWLVTIGPNVLGYHSLDMKKSPANQLSGCITFSDIKMEMVAIKIDQSNCEDAVHFVRVTGFGVDLNVTGAFSDGADADFSNIKFGSINIDGAGNDCVDLSSGVYQIQRAMLNDCSDKGISAGESSEVEVRNVITNVASIGVAGKDSSKVYIDSFSFKDVEFCFAAYQKKVSYMGGEIFLGEGECIEWHVAKIFEQKGSSVSGEKL